MFDIEPGLMVGVYSIVFFIDVLSIPQTGEHFRLLYDVKGRFELVPISAEESTVCSVLFWLFELALVVSILLFTVSFLPHL